MAGVGWFMTIILGGLAGWIAEKLMKADMGLFANILLGIVGALVLNYILGFFVDYPVGYGSWIAQSIVAVIGACLLIYAYRAIKGRS